MKLTLACLESLLSERRTHPTSQAGHQKPPKGKHEADALKKMRKS